MRFKVLVTAKFRTRESFKMWFRRHLWSRQHLRMWKNLCLDVCENSSGHVRKRRVLRNWKTWFHWKNSIFNIQENMIDKSNKNCPSFWHSCTKWQLVYHPAVHLAQVPNKLGKCWNLYSDVKVSNSLTKKLWANNKIKLAKLFKSVS